MKKTLAILLVLVLAVLPLAACADTSTPSESTPPPSTPNGGTPGTPEPVDEPDPLIGEGLKAAMILPGPISDIGFSGPAYQGLLRIESELGYEISYTESVAAADYENVFRTYASEGYDIIFAHGAQFLETAMLVAENFPDTWFAISSGFGTNEKNISGWNLSSYDVGFMAGALMAQMTQTNKIGIVSGAELPPIAMIYDGMRVGAAYINPDIQVQNVYTAATADMAQCKEAAVALLDSGCDLLSSSAGVGSPGVIAACAEAGKYFVGTSADWSSIDPSTVLNSVLTDWGEAAVASARLFAQGELQPRPYMNGIAEGAVHFVDYGEEALKVIPADVLARMDQIIADLQAGKININEMVAALPK